MTNPTGGFDFSHHRLLDTHVRPCACPISRRESYRMMVLSENFIHQLWTLLTPSIKKLERHPCTLGVLVMPNRNEVWEHISCLLKMEIDVTGSLCSDVAKDVGSHFKTLNPQSWSPPLIPYTYNPLLLYCLFKTSASAFTMRKRTLKAI